MTPAPRSDRSARRISPEWLRLALVAALAATAVEALLIQRSKSIFTGGFLADDVLAGPGEIGGFLLGSVVSDLGFALPFTALGLWFASRLGLGTSARRLLALGAALAPFALANFVDYQIATHLGAAFDLGLMFDLVGRRPSEIWAVAGAHLVKLGLALAGAALAGVLFVWVVNRLRPAVPPRAGGEGGSRRRTLLVSAAALLAGLVVTTALRVERASFDNALRRKASGAAYGYVVASVSDVDRDGSGVLSSPPDPAPFDATVSPYGVDLPGNGIDEDAVGGDLPAGYPRYAETPPAGGPWTHTPDVVFVVLETFRADAVGATLGGKAVTPVLDALARRGVSARHAYSHNGYTVQSRFHLFSGSLANLRGGQTLIDDFNAQGYDTAYFSAQDESFGGGELPVGFERARVFYDARQDRSSRYSTFATPGSLAVPAALLEERIKAFLAERTQATPLFLHVNFHDTHFPYTHPGIQPLVDPTVVARGDIVPSRRDDVWRMYLNTAANVDAAIGRVLDGVRRTTGREPAVIVTADHGESLFEEGFLGHGYAINDVQTRVPLIVTGVPMDVREPWGQIDLRDALLAALRSDDPARPPRVVPDDREVFQYLGRLHRPRQIGFTSLRSRAVYDVRDRRFRLDEGPWLRPGDLRGAERDAFLRVVRYWESVRVAQAGARR